MTKKNKKTPQYDFANMTYGEFQDLYEKYGSERKTVKALGIKRTTLQNYKKSAYKRMFTAQRMEDATIILPTDQVQVFILSAAQDSSKVHKGFLKNIEAYAQHRNAEIMIAGYTYNKSMFEDHSKAAGVYESCLGPYLISDRVMFGEDLMFCAEVNTLPTAVNPLSGMATYTGQASGVFPHAKYHLDSIPVDKESNTKIIQTTGTMTYPNYVQKKAGQKAEHYHEIGASVVELLPDGRFFVRHIAAGKNGDFQDLGYKVESGKVTEGHRVMAVTWGDIHHEKKDDVINYACWGVGPDIGSPYLTMADELRPEFSFIHDIIDFKPRNHHNIKDPHFMYEMHIRGEANVEDTLAEAADFLHSICHPDTKTVVVQSNHDLALMTWLKTADYRIDPENAEFFLRTQAEVYSAIKANNKDFQVLAWAFYRSCADLNVKWLVEDESFTIANGIQCGCHGHLGANGSRGNPMQFSRTGRRSNTAHTHSATVRDGAWVAGVSGSLDMGYNKGLSSWSHSHIITLQTGKRQMVTQYPDGLWCADALQDALQTDWPQYG